MYNASIVYAATYLIVKLLIMKLHFG